MSRCKKFKGEIASTESVNYTQIHFGEGIFEVVPTFQYLGSVIGELGGCVNATSKGITAAWKGCRQLLPNTTNCVISLRNWSNIFSSCIRKSQLYGCKTCSPSSKIIRRLTSVIIIISFIHKKNQVLLSQIYNFFFKKKL